MESSGAPAGDGDAPAQDMEPLPELRARYQALIDRGVANPDKLQEQAIAQLADLSLRLQHAVTASDRGGRRSRLGALLRALPGLGTGNRDGTTTPERGIYLWGGVGRGKTWVMDLFFECLPFPDKRRSHFHRFMYDVHERLRGLTDTQDPLARVADDIAAQARVLCFDELFVSDITDAMLLGTLFKELFARGVTLVTTSNVPPSGLYRDGLQRARFLPAIDLLEAHTQVIHLDSGTDYRLRLLERAEIYHHPLDENAEANLARYFAQLCADLSCSTAEDLAVEGRLIPARRIGDGVVWFDFDAICDGPRGQTDYIAIAAEFHTVLVSNVPRLTATHENQARRFIALVDEFYDRSVKLIISAAEPVDHLYAGERLGFEFERTRSRLQEMQSREYLATPHVP
jgi:cell division protein ZapE